MQFHQCPIINAIPPMPHNHLSLNIKPTGRTIERRVGSLKIALSTLGENCKENSFYIDCVSKIFIFKLLLSEEGPRKAKNVKHCGSLSNTSLKYSVSYFSHEFHFRIFCCYRVRSYLSNLFFKRLKEIIRRIYKKAHNFRTWGF